MGVVQRALEIQALRRMMAEDRDKREESPVDDWVDPRKDQHITIGYESPVRYTPPGGENDSES
jgi:hypothetical protein